MTLRTRRLVGAIAFAMAIVALMIATRPLLVPAEAVDLTAPSPIPAPLLTLTFLSVPALIAAIGAMRSAPVILVIAGVLSLLQSLVAFSGVTLGFLLPGLMLIYLGVREGEAATNPRPTGRHLVTGVFVLALIVSAWVVVLTTSETVCWVARLGSDGTPMYRRIPEANSIEIGANEIGGGCDSAVPTVTGLLASATLIVGALVLAWTTDGTSRRGTSSKGRPAPPGG
jgi:hypothetical protein